MIVAFRFAIAAFLGLLACCLVSAADADDGPAALSPAVHTFLKQHCFECHGSDAQESGLRYDGILRYRTEDTHLWTLVHQKLSAGEMPPKESPRPTAAETETVLKWIETQQQATAASSLRRLNRRELAAALRELTGLAVDYAQGLPGDGKVAGFDTGADGLHDAADSVAQIMNVTRRAVDGIRFLGDSPGKVLSADLRGSKDPKKTLDEWKTAGATTKGQGIPRPGVGWLLPPSWVGDREEFSIRLAPTNRRSGVLRLKLVVSTLKPLAGIPNPRLWVEVGNRAFDHREINGTAEQPQELLYEIQVDDLPIDAKGIGIALANKVELPYAIAGFDNEERNNPEKPIPGGGGLFRPAFDKRKLPPEEQPVPHLVVHSIEIESGYVASWPPASWQAEQGEIKDNTASAERLLDLWIDRAWRRPATKGERARFLALYQQVRKDGLSFDDALRAAFQSVLLSAPFRYLASPVQEDAAAAHYAIAARLSFLLTGSPPDAELRQLAAHQKLRDPAVLNAQVDRLLLDPRSAGFVRPFVTQWLEAEQPITLVMTSIQKQDFRFGRYLKESMREETIAYIAHIFSENRPAREIIDSDWTMMNDSLAVHYGYDGVTGGTLRKVKLRPDDPRGGGILGHAGIQSMLCWMGDNWVIYRGAWTMRHILNHPPPPPPLEVPELVPSEGANRGKSFRELLKQHQEDRRCAVCHKHMDPVGFAFQNFDISGRWREVEHERYVRNELDGKIEWNGAGNTRPVDAAGRMPRGEEFKSYQEFKQLVAERYQDDLVRGLLENFVVYAAGRQPDVRDMQQIQAIMKEQKPNGYRLCELMKAVVRSPVFLDR